MGFVVSGLAKDDLEHGGGLALVEQPQAAMIDGRVPGLQPGCQAGEQAAGGEQQGFAAVGGGGQREFVAETLGRREPEARVRLLAARTGQQQTDRLGLPARKAGGGQGTDIAQALCAEAAQQFERGGGAVTFAAEHRQWQGVQSAAPVAARGQALAAGSEPARGERGGGAGEPGRSPSCARPSLSCSSMWD